MALKLGTLLVREGVISTQQLEEALRLQSVYGGRLGSNLVDSGMMDVDGLAQWLSRQLGFPPATDAMLAEADPEVLQLIPGDLADKHECYPFRRDGRRLHVAMSNPADLSAADALSFKTGLRIVPYIAPEAQLQFYLEKRYSVVRKLRFIRLSPRLAGTSLPVPAGVPRDPVLPPPTGQRDTGEAPTPTSVDPDATPATGYRFPTSAPPRPSMPPLRESTTPPGRGPPSISRAPLSRPGSAAVPMLQAAPYGAPGQMLTPGPSASPAAPLPPMPPMGWGLAPPTTSVPSVPPLPPGWQASSPPRSGSSPPEVRPQAYVATVPELRPAPVPVSAPPPQLDSVDLRPVASALANTTPGMRRSAEVAAIARAAQAPQSFVPAPSFPDAEAAVDLSSPAGDGAVETARQALSQATTRDEIAQALLSIAGKALDTVLVFQVRDGMALGWKGAGTGLAAGIVELVMLPLNAPSMFQEAADAAAPIMASIGSATLHKHFYKALRRAAPASAIVVPIVIHGRAVNLIYGDRLQENTATDAIDGLQTLAQAAAEAYERILRETKRRTS